LKKYIYKKSDAFTSENSLGNPAACIFTGQDSLSEDEMLSIAKQHKGFVSEVVYCSDSKTEDCKLVYYSSECEVDFCGHGTIAAMYELLKDDKELCEKDEITFETNNKGTLVLYNQIKTQDCVYITAPQPKKHKVLVSSDEIASAFGVGENVISKKYPIGLIDAGLRTLIVPISSYKDEISIFPCEEHLKAFCLNNKIDIILIFCMETNKENYIAHTRVFAPKFGYLEDPATGSGNSAFGYYMYDNKIWDGSLISLEQGGNDRIFNTVKLMMNEDNTVLFGGKATLRIDGNYVL